MCYHTYVINTKAGLSKYISPDNQVDTSTARFKDSTWVIKNATHDNRDVAEDLTHQFLWGTNVTVESLESKLDGKHYTRFMLYDSEKTRESNDGFDANLLVPMTEENCTVTQWEDVHHGKESTLFTKLASLFRWLTSILRFFTSKLK